MKIAVIGGGLFGCTAAWMLARRNEVHLFEVQPELLTRASANNQFRLHRGFHYPRSPETIEECKAALDSFEAQYPAAVAKGGFQYYAIPKEGSKTTPTDFEYVMAEHNLWFDLVKNSGWFNDDVMDAVYRVEEDRVDLLGLKFEVELKLAETGVRVHKMLPAHPALRDKFDKIIVACYAGNNEVLETLGCKTQLYKYQLVEKPVVRLPDEMSETGIVIIDGPFGCVDPMASSPFHLLGHVTKAVHREMVGIKPEFGPQMAIESNVSNIISDLVRYIPVVGQATPVKSLTVTRMVLPMKEDTDERPTLVTKHDDQVMSIFSGKMSTCVNAAQEIIEEINT